MTQQKVSQETLVRLAQSRILSTVFEKAWQERMYVNPVAMAIQMSQRESNKQAWDVLVWMSLAMTIYIVMFLVAFGTLVLSNWVSILIGVPCMIVVLLGIRWKFKNPPITYTGMDDFLADINALCTWLYPKFLPVDVLLSSNEGAVKFATHSLLVSEAIALTRLEQEKGGDAVERLRRVGEMDLLRKSFTLKYGTLARLGPASGGFEKFFKEAKRQVKAAKTEASQVAA